MKGITLFLTLLLVSPVFAYNSYYSKTVQVKLSSAKVSEKYVRQVFSYLINKSSVLSYKQARKELYGKLWVKYEKNSAYIRDIYCNRKVYLKKVEGTLELPKEASVNCEHSWPQSKFNDGENVKAQKSDLHHLFPADMRANSTRSNHPYGETYSNEGINSHCQNAQLGEPIDLEEIRKDEVYFEPPNHIKGDISRALFYFSFRYKVDIDQVQESFLRHWNEIDPVDQDERERNDKVEKIQGNRNPFVDFPQLVDNIENF